MEPQKLGMFGKSLIVSKLDFPVYFISKLTYRHFFVAGGGGSSKTGVTNQINLYELIPYKDSCKAVCTLKYETPAEVEDAIMNASLLVEAPIANNKLIAAGNPPYIYSIDFDCYKQTFDVSDYEPFRPDILKSSVKSVKCVIGKVLVGGSDGKLTVFCSFDLSSKPFHHIQAHTDEIDEIDVETSLQLVVTTCRSDQKVRVWSVDTMDLVHEFQSSHINQNANVPSQNSPKYNFRSSKFAYCQTPNAKKDKNSFLLAVCNPNKTKASSKLHKWSSKSFELLDSIELINEPVMAFNVNTTGDLCAVGTGLGGVIVYDVESFKQIYKVNAAHTNLVTQLEFLPPDREQFTLTNSRTFTLISASIDRRIILHMPVKSYHVYIYPMLFFVLIPTIFSLRQYLL